MMRVEQNTWWGIGASLGLHGLAAIVLLFGLSAGTMMSRDPGKLDLMWVSIAVGDQTVSGSHGDAGKTKTPQAANKTVTLAARTVVQDVRVESEKSLEGPPADSDDKTMVSPGVKTIAHAAGGGDSLNAFAGRSAAASGVSPASSVALPLYRENPPPGYPAVARQQGYEGVVLVKVEVLTNGRVGQTVVRKSSGYAILDQAAVNAVKTWKFEPAKKSGIPYKTWAELPIKFVISDRNSQS